MAIRVFPNRERDDALWSAQGSCARNVLDAAGIAGEAGVTPMAEVGWLDDDIAKRKPQQLHPVFRSGPGW
jgi:hypothetical protein